MTRVCDFQASTLDQLNRNIWEMIYNHGEPLTFGDPAEIKKARYIYSTVVFEGETLDSVNRGIMPKGWLFTGQCVQTYKEQFDNRQLWKGFEYTYAQRLLEYEIPNPEYPTSIPEMLSYIFWNRKLPPHTLKLNQLEHMKDQLLHARETGIQSTRIIAITLQPHLDYYSNDIPCLQVIQILLLPGGMAEIHYLFRSHDYGNGLMANLCQLNNAMIKHVLIPAGVALKRVIVTSWVAHLYENDMSMIEKVVKAC